jgi:hypothetical protein
VSIGESTPSSRERVEDIDTGLSSSREVVVVEVPLIATK